MLAQFTITKAIHNKGADSVMAGIGWNASSIYNYESHSQQKSTYTKSTYRLECQLNLQLRKPFTTIQGQLKTCCLVGMLAQFTITKAIHNTVTPTPCAWRVGMLAQFTITKAIHNCDVCSTHFNSGWNASSIYNYESHSQHSCGGGGDVCWLECQLNLQLRKPFTTV